MIEKISNSATDFTPGSLMWFMLSIWFQPWFYGGVHTQHLISSLVLWWGSCPTPDLILGALVRFMLSPWFHPCSMVWCTLNTWFHSKFYGGVPAQHLISSLVLWWVPCSAPDFIPGSLVGFMPNSWFHPWFFGGVHAQYMILPMKFPSLIFNGIFIPHFFNGTLITL